MQLSRYRKKYGIIGVRYNTIVLYLTPIFYDTMQIQLMLLKDVM